MEIVNIVSALPRHPTRKWAQRNTADKIVVHCTAGSNQNPKETALYHITPGPQNHLSKNGAPGIAYTDFITKTGKVYHCNEYSDITWHAGLWNTPSVGVVLAYLGLKEAPPAEQIQVLVELLTHTALLLHIPPQKIYGHREVPGMYTIVGKGSKRFKKECPGMKINLDALRLHIARQMQEKLYFLDLYNDKIDGDFGPKSRAALAQVTPIHLEYGELLPAGWKYPNVQK